MTSTSARLLPVQPGRVRNAILNALARHGIEPATAESIFNDLTTGNDPRPGHLPASISYRGINVVWPLGRHTRPLRPDEIRSLNSALRAARGGALSGMDVRKRGEELDAEDTAEVGRHAYTFLVQHMAGPNYNPEPVRAAQMRELVEEATQARQAEPVLCGCGADIQVGAATHECLPIACLELSPSGKRACLLAIDHEGDHKNGCTKWKRRLETPAVETPAEVASEDDPLAALLASLAELQEQLGVGA